MPPEIAQLCPMVCVEQLTIYFNVVNILFVILLLLAIFALVYKKNIKIFLPISIICLILFFISTNTSFDPCAGGCERMLKFDFNWFPSWLE